MKRTSRSRKDTISGANAPRLKRVARMDKIRRKIFLHWFGPQAVVSPGNKYVFFVAILQHFNISQLVFPTDDACDKAWNGDPKSFPEIGSPSGMREFGPIVVVVVATGINSREERDDGKVDKEDHRESNQQHGEAFYCAARKASKLLVRNILAEVISPIK